jgi:hypothetical protein
MSNQKQAGVRQPVFGVWTKVSENRSKMRKRKKEAGDEKGQSRRGMEKAK